MSSYCYEYHRSHLSPIEQQAYDEVLHGLQAGQVTIKTKAYPTSIIHGDTIKAILYDHPELFWADLYATRFSSGTFSGGQFQFDAFYSGAERQRLIREAEDWRRQVLAGINPNDSRRIQIYQVFNHLARSIEYEDLGPAHSHTIVGCYSGSRHVCVCEGIAKGMKYLLDGLGIPCILCSGELTDSIRRGGHGWNIVEIAGKYYHVDATNEIRYAHRIGHANTQTFLHTDNQMRDYRWDHTLYPRCM